MEYSYELSICYQDFPPSYRQVLNLVGQYLRRTTERGGAFWDCEKGISLGCPLSPLIGAFFLNRLDAALSS
jgi:hypothetical protein